MNKLNDFEDRLEEGYADKENTPQRQFDDIDQTARNVKDALTAFVDLISALAKIVSMFKKK